MVTKTGESIYQSESYNVSFLVKLTFKPYLYSLLKGFFKRVPHSCKTLEINVIRM